MEKILFSNSDLVNKKKINRGIKLFQQPYLLLIGSNHQQV